MVGYLYQAIYQDYNIYHKRIKQMKETDGEHYQLKANDIIVGWIDGYIVVEMHLSYGIQIQLKNVNIQIQFPIKYFIQDYLEIRGEN